jgi:hypothetical protein
MIDDLKIIAGKKVLEIRSINRSDERIVLFSDKKTVMRLEEQDYHDYHDCCSDAYIVTVIVDKNQWKNIYNDKVFYRRIK